MVCFVWPAAIAVADFQIWCIKPMIRPRNITLTESLDVGDVLQAQQHYNDVCQSSLARPIMMCIYDHDVYRCILTSRIHRWRPRAAVLPDRLFCHVSLWLSMVLHRSASTLKLSTLYPKVARAVLNRTLKLSTDPASNIAKAQTSTVYDV